MEYVRERHAAHLLKPDFSDGYVVNLHAYTAYLDEHYPELERPNLHLLEKIDTDMTLHNVIDMNQYEGLNSPDDVWDRIARSLYGMGYLGVYSRIATRLECGKNYVFNFEEFAHIYPCLRSMQGNALKLKHLQSTETDIEIVSAPETNKKMVEHYIQMYRQGREFIRSTSGMKGNPTDVELERRSIFNKTLIYDEDTNMRGTTWTYLTAENEKIKYENSFTHQYGLSPTLRKPHDNKKYIYEKFVFCTAACCSGTMRIVLDCIHQLVIVSMIIPHFDCLETHKRRVFDVVRKLVVLHKADLSYIDELYLSVPRRYGLTFVESFKNTSEYDTFKKSEYTPSYYCYDSVSFEEDLQLDNWSLGKSRTWLTDIYYDKKDSDDDAVKKRRAQEKENSLQRAESDFSRYGSFKWETGYQRRNKLGGVIYRDEWEFSLPINRTEKLREIYRVFRIMYFEISDKLKTSIKHSTGSMLTLSQYYLIQFNDTNKLYFNENLVPKILESEMVRLSTLYKQNAKFLLFSIVGQTWSPAFNPQLFFPPYPLNKRTGLGFSFTPDILVDNSKYVIINASIEEIANSDEIHITQRYFEGEFGNQRTQCRTNYANTSSIHKSPPRMFLENMSNAIADDKYLKDTRILNDTIPERKGFCEFATDGFPNTLKPHQWDFLAKLKSSDKHLEQTNSIMKTQDCWYKLSQIKYTKNGVTKDAFMLHTKYHHQGGFISALLKARSEPTICDLKVMDIHLTPRNKEIPLKIHPSTEDIYKLIDMAADKFKLDLVYITHSRPFPVEILSLIVTEVITGTIGKEKLISDCEKLMLRYRPPLRFPDSAKYKLRYDSIIPLSTTRHARANFQWTNLIVGQLDFVNNLLKFETTETGDRIFNNEIFKYDNGFIQIFKKDRCITPEDSKKWLEFNKFAQEDVEKKTFDELYDDISKDGKVSTLDMVEVIRHIRKSLIEIEEKKVETTKEVDTPMLN